MTKQNLEKALRRELASLNEIIDRKIIRGLPYSREARRHKFVMNSLANIRRSKMNWMMRSIMPFSFV